MSLGRLSYDSMTQRIGCMRCNGCEIGNHRLGWVDMSNGIIHWHDRQVRRSGIRRYLKLAAAILFSHNQGQPEWKRIYEQATWAQSSAQSMFHVRLPQKWSYLDRARVEYLSARTEVPPEVLRWSRNRG